MAALNALPAVPGDVAPSKEIPASFVAPPSAQGNFHFTFPEPATNPPEGTKPVAPPPPPPPPVAPPPVVSPPPPIIRPSELAYRAPESLFQPPPVSTLPPGAVPAQAPPRSFQPGEHVKFCPDATVNCIKEEAVVQHVFPGQYGEPAYSVYLTKRKQHVTVPGELLAPVIDTGSRMVFYPEDGGGPQEVEVEEIYASRWPPTYLVMSPGRGLLEVEDDRLIKPPPQAVAAASPPVVATRRSEVEADLATERAIAAALAEAELEDRRNLGGDDLSAIPEGTEYDDGGTDDGDVRSVSTSVAAEEIAAEALASVHAENEKIQPRTETESEPETAQIHNNEENNQQLISLSLNSQIVSPGADPGAGADHAGFAPGDPGTFHLPEGDGYPYYQVHQPPPAHDGWDSMFVEDTTPPPISPLAGGPIIPPVPPAVHSDDVIEPLPSPPTVEQNEDPHVFNDTPLPVEKPCTVYYPTYEPPQVPPPTMPPPLSETHFVEPSPGSSFHESPDLHAVHVQHQAPPPQVVVPVPVPVPIPVAAVPAAQYEYNPNYEPPMEAMIEAQKVTKSAASALSFEDVPTAVKYLQDALNMLTQPGAHKSGRKR